MNGIRLLWFLVVCAAASWIAAAPVKLLIEAEDFDASRGVIVTRYRESIDECGDGDWARYDSITFGDEAFDSLTLYVRKASADGRIEMRLDDTTGRLIATVPLRGISGPVEPLSAAIEPVSGIHSVYLLFSGGQDVAEVNRFALTGELDEPAADAHTYYVSPTGDDTYDGRSIDTPFRTIRKASSVMTPGSRCVIREGIYRETIRPAFTGTAGAPITYEAYGDERVLISACDTVGEWQRHEGNIYKARMGRSMGRTDCNQVFVDGEMMALARSPNVGGPCPKDENERWYQGEEAVFLNSKCFLDRQGEIFPWLIPALQSFGNCGEPVQAFSEATSFAVCWDSYESAARGLRNRERDFFAGGIFLAYTSPWWSVMGRILDSEPTDLKAGRMNVARKSGANMKSPKGKGGFICDLYGLLDSPGEWYRDPRDSTLYLWCPDGDDPGAHLVEAKSRLLVADLASRSNIHLEGLQAMGGSMSLENAEQCIIDDCHFYYITHMYLLEDYERGSYTYGSPYDPSSGYKGIYISGKDNVFKNSTVAYSAGSGIILDGTDNEVRNCRIHSCNYVGSYDAPIFIYNNRFSERRKPSGKLNCTGQRILHNTLHGANRSLINFCTAGATELNPMKIQYNEFHTFCLNTFEGAAIYTYGGVGKGTECSHNWFHSFGPTKCGYIAFDVNHAAWRVHHNVCWNGRPLIDMTIRCNICADTTVDTVYNNTIIDSSWGGEHWPREGRGRQFADGGINTLYAGSNPEPWKFADPDRHHYWLTEGSPAIDAGTTIPGLVESFRGAAPDLGAYEYGEEPWVAGADWEEKTLTYPAGGAARIRTGDRHLTHGSITPPLHIGRQRIRIGAASRLFTVRIVDPRGRTVMTTRTDLRTPTTLDLRSLSHGHYLLQIRNEHTSIIRKMMLVR
jgi:hypothetical protein